MPKRKRCGLLALALSAALLPCPALSGGVALGVAGCGCKSGEICSESELPASMSPEAVHHTVWACKSEEKKAP